MKGPASFTDAAVMAQLHKACFDAPWSAASFADMLAKPDITALGDENGFIMLQKLPDNWEILTLAVAPQARRKGLATALLTASFAVAGNTPLWLEVAADNLAALALYRASGFVETGRRKAYYKRAGQTRVDALLMQSEQGLQ